MSDEKHNAMGPVMEADADCEEVFEAVKKTVLSEIHRINKEDAIHGLHEMDKRKARRISTMARLPYAYSVLYNL
ncbi:hypothetical protein BGX34_003084 [Mortierella sp. NVP85]|nr:hypothetical protein BGX34_003084 [Mortierella sp. NVP85]